MTDTTSEDGPKAVYTPADGGRPFWVPEEPPADLVDGEGPQMSRYTFLATSEATHGEITVINTEVPAGNGPPEHMHDDADEAFYGLEGSFWFRADGQEFVLHPGDFAFVRRGTQHVWKNNTDGSARMLRMYTPAGHEKFFFEIGRPDHGEDQAPQLTAADVSRAEAAAERFYGHVA